MLQVTHDVKGDWQFLDAGSEQPGECRRMCLGCIVERDPTLAQLGDLPPGWSAHRAGLDAPWERWREDGNQHAAERKALDDIDTYGLHILHVAEAGELPPFSYSIGIGQSLGLPELIVIGLRHEVAQAALNACYAMLKSGQSIVPGARVAGLLGGGFECELVEVSPTQFRQYMGWAWWLYDGPSFRAYQIVFPNTAGVYPWEPAADAWFRNWQPLLNEAAAN
ncbi:DUF4262 domain-containing protein [Massilia sp. H6]|uniref:DUF4262 domain-containing protein n=1 Tax=Massilia sp. H6 TaxID=2970464 RepID=UPI00216A9380|nr:DUF4262 domain-containing protein [Massilia sp. H6]UVW29200.1 DUF4262 domain-containing protein [Massilia sp. H6]